MIFSERALIVIFSIFVLTIIGCSTSEPDPIVYGSDACDYCRMTIVDEQFATEVKSDKGKAFKFDSIECLSAFLMTQEKEGTRYPHSWVTNFSDPAEFLTAPDAVYVHSTQARSPMGVGLFAFEDRDAADGFAEVNNGVVVAWSDVFGIVSDAWALGARGSGGERLAGVVVI